MSWHFWVIDVLALVSYPLSQFPESAYVISRKEQEPKKEKHIQLETAEEEKQHEAVSIKDDINADFKKLLSVYKENGEVWGIAMSSDYYNSPVILRDLKIGTDQRLTGKIVHPYQNLVNEFSMMGGRKSVSLQIMAANPRNQGMRKASLGGQVEGDELVIRNGARIALSSQKSMMIQESFKQKLEPWNYTGDISDLFLINRKLFRVDTLEEVSSAWVQSNSAVSVKNLPNRFISAETIYTLTQRPYGAYCAEDVETVEPEGRPPLHPIPESGNSTWVSFDMKEYVTLRDGDVWYGKIDWQGNTVKDERNISNLGILNDLEPISWYKNDFYFYQPSGSEKPILRININTGAIDELEETKALHKNSLGSPDGRFIFFSDGKTRYLPSGNESFLYVYDCKTRQSFTMDATIDERKYIGNMKQDSRSLTIGPSQWLSKSLFITSIGWYDLEKRTRNIFIEADSVIRDRPEQNFQAIRFCFIPATNFVDVTVKSYIVKSHKGEDIYRRYRINRMTNETVELPMEFEKDQNNNGNITWIDENRYIFSKKAGSLSEIGTWLYDLRNKKYKKLTSFVQNGTLKAENYCIASSQDGSWKSPFYFYNKHLVFPDKQRIVFPTNKGNSSILLSVSLTGKEAIEISQETQWSVMRRLLPFSVKLPYEIEEIKTAQSFLNKEASEAEQQTSQEREKSVVPEKDADEGNVITASTTNTDNILYSKSTEIHSEVDNINPEMEKTEYEISEVDTQPERIRAFPFKSPCGIERRIVVRVLIGIDGKPKNFEILEYEITNKGNFDEAYIMNKCAGSQEEYFEKVILPSLKRFKFKPGIKDDQPVPTWLEMPLIYIQG